MDITKIQFFIWRLLLTLQISEWRINTIVSSTATSSISSTIVATTISIDSLLSNKSIQQKLTSTNQTNDPTISTTTISPITITTAEAIIKADKISAEIKASNIRSTANTANSFSLLTTASATVDTATSLVTAAATTATQVTIGSQWTDKEKITEGNNNGADKIQKSYNESNSSSNSETISCSSVNSTSSINSTSNKELHETKSQEVDLGSSKQRARPVQQELPSATTNAPVTDEKKNAVGAKDDKNLLHNKLSTGEELEVATIAILSTSTKAASSDEGPWRTPNSTAATTTTEAMSSPALLQTMAATSEKIRAATTTTTAMRTTTRTTTTTAKPFLPPAVDGYQTVISQAGTHAYLPCNVKQLVKKPISWLRVRDGHILTVDQTTFIADQRFQSIFTPNPERWSLQIKYVQLKDAGSYECQVSTEPKTSAIVTLVIVEPRTRVIGESTRHVKVGSAVKLRCVISEALEPPIFINWFHNQKQIYLHNRREWRTEIERVELTTEAPTTTTIATAPLIAPLPKFHRKTVGAATPATTSGLLSTLHASLLLSTGRADRASTAATSFPTKATTTTTTRPWRTVAAAADVKQITTASLIIPSVEKQDSGNYTCSPSNSAPVTVVLHVLSGEYSASAITSGTSSIGRYRNIRPYRHLFFTPFNLTAILAVMGIFWLSQLLHFDSDSRSIGTLKFTYIARFSESFRNRSTEQTTIPSKSKAIIGKFEEKT